MTVGLEKVQKYNQMTPLQLNRRTWPDSRSMDWALIKEKLVRISMKTALMVYILEENGEDVLQV